MKKLSSEFIRFTVSHCAFLILTTISSVFINTFLMAKADLTVVLLYNILSFLFTAASMHIAPFVMGKRSVNALSKIGVLMYVFIYILLAVLMERVIEFYALIGALMGMAAGFYWLGYNNIVNEITVDESRDKALGILSVGSAVLGIIVPIVTGYIISLLGDSGYLCVFSLAAGVAAIAFILYSRLISIKTRSTPSLKKMKKTYVLVMRDKIWRICLLGEITKGIREGAMTFILSVALYSLVKDEFLVGLNTLATGIAAVISSLLISRLIRPANRIKYMLASVTFMVLMTVPLIAAPTPFMIVIFSILNYFFQNFLINPSLGIMFLVFEKKPGVADYRSEMFAVRELALDVGRGAGISLFLFSPDNAQAMAVGLLVITLIQYVTVALNNITVKQIRCIDTEKS